MGWRDRFKENAQRALAKRRPGEQVQAPRADLDIRRRDIEAKAVTPERKMAVESLRVIHQPINDQLAILRATRGQREVGTLKVPGHLSAAMEVSIGGNAKNPNADTAENRIIIPAGSSE